MATQSAHVSAGQPPSTGDSALTELTRVIRSQAAARDPRHDLVWQPRFAYASAVVILTALTVVSLPIWLVFYRMADADANNGAGPNVAHLVALSMMLLGGLVTAGAAWVIIIEMRGRVRMVDRLAQTNDRELRPADLELVPVAPSDEVTQTLVPTAVARPAPAGAGPADTSVATGAVPADTSVPTGAPTASTSVPTGVLAAGTSVQAGTSVPGTSVPGTSVPATLEASGHLLHSFSRVLRAFSQLPAQVALLAVALSLFVGATLLSMD